MYTFCSCNVLKTKAVAFFLIYWKVHWQNKGGALHHIMPFSQANQIYACIFINHPYDQILGKQISAFQEHVFSILQEVKISGHQVSGNNIDKNLWYFCGSYLANSLAEPVKADSMKLICGKRSSFWKISFMMKLTSQQDVFTLYLGQGDSVVLWLIHLGSWIISSWFVCWKSPKSILVTSLHCRVRWLKYFFKSCSFFG